MSQLESIERDVSPHTMVERFFGEYVRALDDRRFNVWLGLFAEEAFYGVIRHEDHVRDDDLFILGESMEKLRVRVRLGVEVDRQMQVHMISGVRIDELPIAGGTLKASANFLVLKDNYIAYAGQYRAELLCVEGRMPKIKRCVAIISNERPAELLYLPI